MLSLLFRSLWALALLADSASAGATMVKCRGVQGSVVYQDAPCRAGDELRNFDIDPANVSVVPFAFPNASAPGETARANAPRPRSVAVARQPGNTSGSSRAADRRFIRVGMSEAEVLQRIGKPEVQAGTGRNKRNNNKRWSYLPAEGDPQTMTTVVIAGGQVVDVERKIVR